MNICLLTSTFLPKLGGAEICVDQLARQFAALGHTAVVLAPASSRERGPKPGVYPVHHYAKPLTQAGGYLRLKWTLARLHKKYHFDLVNAHLTYPAGYVGLWFREKYHIPLVITPHGGDIFYRSRFRRRSGIWSRICQGLAQADAVIALSSYFQQLIAEIAPDQKNIISIGNGVNNQDFNLDQPLPESLARALGATDYILALGRLVPRKGFEVAIQAFGKICGQFPHVRLVLAGDGNHRTALEQRVRELQLVDRVIFLGRVLGTDKIQLYRHARFTMVPSVEEDNMPLVVLESLACGKPVLGSRLGGIPDVIQPHQTGLLAHPGDVNDFAQALGQLLQPHKVESMREHCLRTAQSLDWNHIARQYLRLFETNITTAVLR